MPVEAPRRLEGLKIIKAQKAKPAEAELKGAKKVKTDAIGAKESQILIILPDTKPATIVELNEGSDRLVIHTDAIQKVEKDEITRTTFGSQLMKYEPELPQSSKPTGNYPPPTFSGGKKDDGGTGPGDES